jgi:hypothetical protein
MFPARHVQANVADRAERHQRDGAQRQRQQRRTQAQQDCRDQWRPQQVAEAGRSDEQHQHDPQQVDHRQEVEHARGIRQALQAPDGENPEQRDRVGHHYGPHPYLEQERDDRERRGGAADQDDGQQGREDPFAPSGEIVDSDHE